MKHIILETNELCKSFKKQTVVKNVSLQVEEGTIYGLLGPNGAGKSTLLKMVTGLLRPTKGEINFNGKPFSRKNLKEMGVLIENPALYGNLTAYENLLIHTTIQNLPKERIAKVLKLVDLKDDRKKKASQFSLGMKQRLGIAIALLNHPKLLILDEPTNGLDPIGIQELRQLIRSFTKQGITVIISSHILSEVEQIADYVGIINEGVLQYQGPIHQGESLESLFMDVVYKGKVKEEF